MKFPVRVVPEGRTKEGEQSAFDAGDFPADDSYPLYIESLGGLSILLISRRQILRDDAGAVKGIHELEVYASSSCDPRCSLGCWATRMEGGRHHSRPTVHCGRSTTVRCHLFPPPGSIGSRARWPLRH
jgi:hypothetical protein